MAEQDNCYCIVRNFKAQSFHEWLQLYCPKFILSSIRVIVLQSINLPEISELGSYPCMNSAVVAYILENRK